MVAPAKRLFSSAGKDSDLGISFSTRLFNAILASRFSKGIGCAPVATGAMPSEKVQQSADWDDDQP